MSSSNSGSVSAVQVASYFVGQYYQALKQQPNLIHQFYADSSSLIRVDGDSSLYASNLMEIHSLSSVLNFNAIEIKTIHSLESWEGGIIVMVTGVVKTKDSTIRKFSQNFFLAPQEKGYFVLNDIFHFIEDEALLQQQHSVPLENHTASSLEQTTSSDYVFVDRAAEYMNSVQLNDVTVDKYSLSDHLQDYENDVLIEEEAQPIDSSRVDSFLEGPKRTYASILRVAKGNAVGIKTDTTPDWGNVAETPVDVVEESMGVEEEEPRSVYVRNVPSDVAVEEIEDAFRRFGVIRPDGVFIRNRKDVVGVCYAFVEFEELASVHNAIKASPIQLCGRQVFIEERRPNIGIASRGGRGRGARGKSMQLEPSQVLQKIQLRPSKALPTVRWFKNVDC